MNKSILKNLNTKYLGRKAFFYEEIDSTQKEIWRRIKNNDIENGTVIISQIQTDGIGTHGRTWYTQEKNNIAFSFFINLNSNIDKLNGLTAEMAEIFVEIFEKNDNIKIGIKAPNDLVINNKKVGGILTETKLVGNTVKCLVIGIGINTNQVKFSKEIESLATSIKNEFEKQIDNEKIIVEFLNIFERKLDERLGEI